MDWTPVEDGKIYCAPACGNGCTRAAYEHAVEMGRFLAQCLGPEWTSQVWENLGWHYNAISPCGRIKVHCYTYDDEISFTAFLGEVDSCGGWWTEHGETPQAAVANVVATGRAELAKIQAKLEGL